MPILPTAQLHDSLSGCHVRRTGQIGQAALLAAEAEELDGVRLILRSFDDQQPAALLSLRAADGVHPGDRIRRATSGRRPTP